MLRDVTKRRILQEMVQRVAAGSNCALVVDERSLKMISAVCKVYDLTEEGVTVVESFEKARQPLPDCDAIYFLTPTTENAKRLHEDFEKEKRPQYRKIHVFLTRSDIGDLFTTRIISAPYALSAMRSFVRFGLDYVSYEQRVFHLDMPNALIDIYLPGADNKDVLEQSAEQLVTLLQSLNLQPAVRFQQTTSRLAEQVASRVHAKLKEDIYGTRNAAGGTLLVLDRSVDVAALLVHEYTYQAMVYDVLDVACCSASGSGRSDDTYSYEFKASDGGKDTTETKSALLSEADAVWVRYRHRHIVSTKGAVRDDISRFAKESEAIRAVTNTRGGPVNSDDLIKSIRGLPRYQEMLAKYWTHMSMTDGCLAEMQSRALGKIGAVEQDLGCGIDVNGADVVCEKLLRSLGALLGERQIGMEEKVRLLLLYFTMMDGVTPDERLKMMEPAQLSRENAACVTNFMRLTFVDGGATAEDTQASGRDKQHVHKHLRDPEKRDFFKRKAKSADFDLSRFEPAVCELMNQLKQDSIHGGKYPFVAEPERPRGAAPTKTKVGGARARNADWGFSAAPANPTPQGTAEEKTSTDKVDVIFILGGITMAEMRCVYEVSRKRQCDIIIGGSSILTPRSTLNGLKYLNANQGGF